MAFAPWVRQFFKELGVSRDKDDNGVHNALLCGYLFPNKEYYLVIPACIPIVGVNGTGYGLVVFTVTFQKAPIFFAEVNHPTQSITTLALMRGRAENFMRKKVKQQRMSDADIPKLFWISFLGSKYCVFEYDLATRTMTLDLDIHADTDMTSDRWGKYDILSLEGK